MTVINFEMIMYHGKLIYVPCADSVLKNIVIDREFGGGGG